MPPSRAPVVILLKSSIIPHHFPDLSHREVSGLPTLIRQKDPPRGAIHESLRFRARSRLAENQAAVVPAETGIVAHGDIDSNLSGLIRHVIEIAVGIGFLVVDGRRNDAGLDGFAASGSLDGAGGSQQVTGHGLG